MKLIVKTVTGDDASIEADESDTVATIKQKLLREQNLQLNEERLIYIEKNTEEGRPVYAVWNLDKMELIDPSIEQNLLFTDNSAATTKISMLNESIPSRSKGGNNNNKNNIKTGWLLKRSDWLKQWRNRYFTLQDNILLFANSETSKPHGKIECADVNIIIAGSVRTIVVSDKTKKQIFMQASSPVEEESWIKAIKQSM